MRQKHVMIGSAAATGVWVVAGACVYGLWVRGCRTGRTRLSTPPAAAARVEAFDADVMQSSRAYDTAERGKRWGKAFEALTLRLVRRRFDGAVYSRDDILRLFGDPDLVAGARDEMFAYFYDRAGLDDAVIYVDFDPDRGTVTLIGYNESSVNDHSPPNWRPYAPPEKARRSDLAIRDQIARDTPAKTLHARGGGVGGGVRRPVRAVGAELRDWPGAIQWPHTAHSGGQCRRRAVRHRATGRTALPYRRIVGNVSKSL
jgi:hypothetical protein